MIIGSVSQQMLPHCGMPDFPVATFHGTCLMHGPGVSPNDNLYVKEK